MQKILITGGAGFIGSHVADALLARGDAVTVLDNFNDFYEPAIKRANAKALRGATVVTGDIRDRELVSALFREGAFSENTTVVVMTAFGGIRQAVEAMRLGASDYLSKPFEFEQVPLALRRGRQERAGTDPELVVDPQQQRIAAEFRPGVAEDDQADANRLSRQRRDLHRAGCDQPPWCSG